MGGKGLEPPEIHSGNPGFPESRGTESGTLGAPEAVTDPDLAELVRAWPTMPALIRAGVLALVRAAEGGKS